MVHYNSIYGPYKWQMQDASPSLSVCLSVPHHHYQQRHQNFAQFSFSCAILHHSFSFQIPIFFFLLFHLLSLLLHLAAGPSGGLMSNCIRQQQQLPWRKKITGSTSKQSVVSQSVLPKSLHRKMMLPRTWHQKKERSPTTKRKKVWQIMGIADEVVIISDIIMGSLTSSFAQTIKILSS